MGFGDATPRKTPTNNPGNFARFKRAYLKAGATTWTDSSGTVRRIIRTNGTLQQMFADSSMTKNIVKAATKDTLKAEQRKIAAARRYNREMARQRQYGRNPMQPPLFPPEEIPDNPIKPPKNKGTKMPVFAAPMFPSIASLISGELDAIRAAKMSEVPQRQGRGGGGMMRLKKEKI